MAKLTKRQKLIAEQVIAGKVYSVEEAVEVLASLPAAKFKESVDVAVNLGIDARKSDQNVRSSTVSISAAVRSGFFAVAISSS